MGVGVTRTTQGESKRMQVKQRNCAQNPVHRNRRNAARRLTFESLESRIVLSGVPLGSMQQDTGEFLLGSVTSTVVLMESTGVGSTETNVTITLNDNKKIVGKTKSGSNDHSDGPTKANTSDPESEVCDENMCSRTC